MLTDHASQFEIKGVNEIPKSFQKLINEIQNVKKNKKQSKNPALDVKTIQKNLKNPITIKKKKKARQPKPLDIDLENNDDESNFPKNNVQILNQTNITEFFNSVKKNFSNCYAEKNSETTKKYEVPVEEETLSSDEDQLFYSHHNPVTEIKKTDFSVSKFQNPDYLNYLSSRNNDLNSINETDRFKNVTESSKQSNRVQTEEVNWKTFNEINTDIDFEFDIERRKNITPSTFYSYNNSLNVKTQPKVAKKINQQEVLLTKNQNIGISTISHKNGSKDLEKDWLAMLKDDQEKIANLLNQVKSMNDTIKKSTQDISKFFMNRNN